LLIISDGDDNRSRRSVHEIKTSVKEADVQIFAIGIDQLGDASGTTEEELTGPELLAGIAEQTGGLAYPLVNLDGLTEIAHSIGIALRDEYVIGYVPRDVPHSGKYRRVELKLIGRRGSARLQTSWRHGYYTPRE
jgi:VWFA-related protein